MLIYRLLNKKCLETFAKGLQLRLPQNYLCDLILTVRKYFLYDPCYNSCLNNFHSRLCFRWVLNLFLEYIIAFFSQVVRLATVVIKFALLFVTKELGIFTFGSSFNSEQILSFSGEFVFTWIVWTVRGGILIFCSPLCR